jgi:hypothetical protein
MLSSSSTKPLSSSVKHALSFAWKIMDKYYSKMDLLNVYWIAMGMVLMVLCLCSILTAVYFFIHRWNSNIFNSTDGLRLGLTQLKKLSGRNLLSTRYLRQLQPLPLVYVIATHFMPTTNILNSTQTKLDDNQDATNFFDTPMDRIQETNCHCQYRRDTRMFT